MSSEVDDTIAVLTPVRGAATLDGEAAARLSRAAAGETVSVAAGAGLARLVLDDGASLLLGDGAQVKTTAANAIEVLAPAQGGRGLVYASVAEGDRLEITTPKGTLRASDASLSIDAAGSSVYVVRGEVSWSSGNTRGIVRAGETLTLGDAPSAAATALWDDWTGGLARPGPATNEAPRGMGVLEGRVPDEIGQARWPLVVRRLDVRVEVVHDLAITEVDQLFFNPASETVEGLYRVTVPDTAVLQRFAVDRNGSLVEGYVREKEQARAAYEAQVYRGSTDDPALLEWDAPGAYRARIYPIAPGETRRIVVRYAEWLGRAAEGAPRLYRYPMGSGGDAPHVQEFSFTANLTQADAASVRAGGGARVEGSEVTLRRSDFRPRADLFLELVGAGDDALHAYRAGHSVPQRAPNSRVIANEADERDYLYVPVVLPESLIENAQPPGIDVVLVADVSAATERADLELGRSVIESIAAHLGAEDRVAIVTSDLAIRSLEVDGPAALAPASEERIEMLLDRLARAPQGGATDLGAALNDAAALLDPTRRSAIVYVGDGAPTVGELAADDLLERLERLPRPARLYAVAVGAEANLDLLEALTRGGGLAFRVEQRAGSADTALRILAHAARPLAQRVTVELGTGVEDAFPRKPTDVVLGDTLAVLARIRGTPPAKITVRGTLLGQPFERELTVTTRESADAADLRLRWASERLRQLLVDGATREEIAELGTRYGLITPYTSFYVPSARELHASAEYELLLERRRDRAAPFALPATLALPLLALACDNGGKDDNARAYDTVTEGEANEASNEDGEGEMAGSVAAANDVTARTATTTTPQGQPVVPAPTPEPAQVQAAPVDAPEEPIAAREEAEAADGIAGVEGGFAVGERGRERAGSIDDLLNQALAGQDSRSNQRLAEQQPSEAPPPDAHRRSPQGGSSSGGELRAQLNRDRNVELDFGAGPGSGSAGYGDHATRITTTTTVYFDTSTHVARRCSDASRLMLDDRRALWRERLQAGTYAGEWVQVYANAVRDCEASTWRDKRALLDLMLARAGSITSMIQLYHALSTGTARGYVRSAIVRRVRTPDDLRAVRQAFGLAAEVDWALVQRLVEQAADGPARIRVLRELIVQYPTSFDLRLRLLEELERQNRTGEVKRLAETLRTDALADAGVRTAIGELYLRLGDEAEARRVFSEIVEFSPWDALARRRLGDLYRAHGWFEEAYRQYQTLLEIRPDDLSVLLLLAQAAAGAGRIDEALRLEQRLAETAQPGAAEGIARVAILWSSVRFAKLRNAAAGNAEQLAEYLARMRRSGVLRESSPMRASLTWSHPDAELSLWAGYPGLSLTRPTDIAPEFGIEVFDVEEVESGTYKIEVRRGGRDLRTAIDAELVVVFGEGTPDEKIEVVPVHFAPEQRAFAWTITGTTLATATPSTEATSPPRGER